jgi:sugar-specific transcriptional regulator TrmB
MCGLIDELTQIGFTEYDARVYLALLRVHPVTGYQVSKESGVPRSMAYESLARLAGQGAVLKSTVGKATTYRPLPPEVLLARLQDAHDARVRTLREGLGRLYVDQAEEVLWSIDGRASVLAYAIGMIRSAESELMVVLPDRDVSDLERDLRAASAEGVRVSLLLTGIAEIDFGEEVVYHPPRESELQKMTGSLVVVVDEREVLIAGNDEQLSATVTTNPNLVLITRQFIWMELFAQRIYARIGADLLEHLDPADRQVLEVYARAEGELQP